MEWANGVVFSSEGIINKKVHLSDNVKLAEICEKIIPFGNQTQEKWHKRIRLYNIFFNFDYFSLYNFSGTHLSFTLSLSPSFSLPITLMETVCGFCFTFFLHVCFTVIPPLFSSLSLLAFFSGHHGRNNTHDYNTRKRRIL